MNRRPPDGLDVSERVRRDFAHLTVILEDAHGHAIRGQALDLRPRQRRSLISHLQRSLRTAAEILNRLANSGRSRA
jgi:hypothetical protein